MKRKTIYALLLLALLALGAWWFLRPESGVRPAACGSPKTILVHVVGGVISVPESPAHVCFGNGVVKWAFAGDSSGYVFPDNGIVFKPNPKLYEGCIANPPSPDRSFHNCTPKQGGSEFHCNKGGPKDTGACYSYTVTVLPTLPNAPIPPPLDPWIISD